MPSIYANVQMIEIAGPWYTYQRAATATELATGEQEVTQYDLDIAARFGLTPSAYQARERERLSKRGLDLD